MARYRPELGRKVLRRNGRWPGLASALILIGSSSYAVFALGGRNVRHDVDPRNPSVRTTEIGFQTWGSAVPEPDWAEFTYQEARGSKGEWRKHGLFVRRDRTGKPIEEGRYRDGQREGRWTFWGDNGSVDPAHSGSYECDILCR